MELVLEEERWALRSEGRSSSEFGALPRVRSFWSTHGDVMIRDIDRHHKKRSWDKMEANEEKKWVGDHSLEGGRGHKGFWFCTGVKARAAS